MGEVSKPTLVVAPTKVNLGTSNLTLRIGTLVDHNVDAIIFHCRVKIFFHGFGYSVNLVDKRRSPSCRLVSNPARVSGLVNHRSRSDSYFSFEFPTYDVSEGGLPEAGWSAKQDML